MLRLFQRAADLLPKATAKCALLTCASGMAWASLIVWILGPAVSGPDMITSVDQEVPPPLSTASFPIVDEGSLLPGWTPLGHHSRFIGREAFPDQFEHWGEDPEVVIHSMDVGPLMEEADQVLPRTDLLLAILSGDDKVRCVLGLQVGRVWGCSRRDASSCTTGTWPGSAVAPQTVFLNGGKYSIS